MADVSLAIQYVLRQEDASMSGVVTTDEGGRTRFGVAEKFHPELTNCLFYSTMGLIAALRIAERLYETNYCQPLHIADIQNQGIADKLLSLGVNCGVESAARMLQEALEVAGDGRIGPLTLDALDRADPKMLSNRLRELAAEHYEDLIRSNPKLAIYRAGWLRRAEA